MKKIFFLLLALISFSLASQEYSRKDSLRGSITDERAWWNLLHYDLDVAVDIEKKSISGKNTISYEVLNEMPVLHLDLQDPMKIKSITQDGEFLTYKKEFSAYFINLVKPQKKGSIEKIEVVFEGIPPESSNPPWDGGFVWKTDKNKNPFIANANQLIGSSSWFPSKDIPYDEPDKGVRFKIEVPPSLTAVANGRLIEEKGSGKSKSFTWEVVNPINGYGINMNIADYVHFSETYPGEKGELDLDYYVLSYNLKKAKKQFKQVPMMLQAFEHWFGPYPFYEDGFKLVETPYLGMEHQSSVTYGNNYENGYLGGDLSLTGQGLKFDFIIIHESGHEWFANSLTNYDVADMWIHEGFTTYSEVLYLDYHFGTEAGNEYLIGFRDRITNNRPVTGIYKVNQRGSGDMYPKGAAMIHTLRQVIGDDEKFRSLLRDINKDFYHQTLSSKQLENYIMDKTSLELEGFFDQYLNTVKVPLLQCKIKNGEMSYRFKNTVDNFNIPVKMIIDKKEIWIRPGKEWQKQVLPNPDSKVSMDPNFYIDFEKNIK
ncbi:M1 family metallopeptidase [Lutimonas saemankumensis]|uniref:M1 family metallopeptidase n=1 Tax=Lutimonas saemankumensis TaxID=483016 RepID=UPI001CD3D83F|nr:M1 family metallopeptidase [Lutimonas saemankumensis]MCA0931613.1 M1 family metallopeptidase [Lutimonas saemankumensis]